MTEVVSRGAPAALHGHAQVDLHDDKADAAKHERHEHRAQEVDGVGVALLDRVEDGAVPDIDPILEDDIDADQDQQPDGQRPGELVTVPSPITAPADPETLQQIFLARLFCPLGRQLWIGFDGFRRRRSLADSLGSCRFDGRCLLLVWLLFARSLVVRLRITRLCWSRLCPTRLGGATRLDAVGRFRSGFRVGHSPRQRPRNQKVS